MRRALLISFMALCAAVLPACDDDPSAPSGSDALHDAVDSADGGSDPIGDSDVLDDATTDIDRLDDGSEAGDWIDVPPLVCLDGRGEAGPAVSGRVYWDVDGSDQSVYVQEFEVGVDAPIAEQPVALLGAAGERQGVTCADGTFTFGSLTDGIYMLDVDLGENVLTTKNQSMRLPDAIREGSVTIVTFGDSLPVFGGEPRYPDVLATLLGEIAAVENVNVARGGTTSEDWMPDEHLFEGVLRPELADADVVMISLGGNDILYYMQPAYVDTSRAAELLDGLDELILEVVDRVLTIVAAIREVNPNVDILYGLYPNYGTSDIWSEQAGAFSIFVETKFAQILHLIRRVLDPADRIILVDLFGATQDLDLDDYLFDELHFNAAGHQLYAEEILNALGGARVGTDPIGSSHALGFAVY